MRTCPFAFVPRWVALVFVLLVSTCAEAPARLWRTVTGQSFEAEFIRAEGANGIFQVKGKEYPYPLNRLSVPDRLLIGKSVNQQLSAGATPSAAPELKASAPAASAVPVPADLQLAGQPLKPGGAVEIEIPLSDPVSLREVKKAYGKPSDKARLFLAVPNDFAPAQKSYPLLIVSATADGAASSIASAHRFLDDAIAKGFVVLAVDGEFGKPPENDSPPFRWALVSAGLEALRREWPEAKNWPIATGGVSGGGGYASHQFLRLAHDHARLIGLFLSVSHWSPIDFPDDFKQAPFSALRDVPIFLSAGEHDQIAGKAITDASHAALVQKGFKQVRYEHFAGGHELNHPHLQAALDWFLEQEKH